MARKQAKNAMKLKKKRKIFTVKLTPVIIHSHNVASHDAYGGGICTTCGKYIQPKSK